MKKVILAILDGVGFRKESIGNAVKNADTPFLDSLLDKYPHSLLEASGNAVGLPKGQMGNSEVGHLTIGSGRVVPQSLLKIDRYIDSTGFINNEVLMSMFNYIKKNGSRLHLCGLLSDGGVHSHINHLFSLLDACKKFGINDVYLHLILDGRDTLPDVSIKYLEELENYIDKNNIGKIASISGRFYAMDREEIWDRVKLYYDVLTSESSVYPDYKSFIKEKYNEGIYDEFIPPFMVDSDGLVLDNDGLLLFNFRPDRLVELCKTFTEEDFKYFPIKKFSNLKLVTMMPVSKSIDIPSLFKHEEVNNTLGEVLSKNNLRVLRIAEDAKFPHVTHFFDGDKDVELSLTNKVKIPRHDVLTYDLDPAMSSYEIVEKIEKDINLYDFICVNFANGDMVGHTGNYSAAVRAMEELDKCIERLYNVAIENDFTLILTADHGNCEEMIGKNGEVLTTHTTNLVYFVVCCNLYKLDNGSLSNIAPSILDIMDIPIPKEMDNSIIKKGY